MSGQGQHLDKEKIRQAIHKIAGDLVPGQPFAWATVQSVDKDAKTAVCKDLTTDLEYYDVLLGLGSIIPVPAKNTTVLLGLTSAGGEASFIVLADEIEEVTVKIGTQQVIIDKDNVSINANQGKLEIKNSKENLKKLLQDLINEIMKITVTTPMGTSGTPINIAQFQVIAKRITMLLS